MAYRSYNPPVENSGEQPGSELDAVPQSPLSQYGYDWSSPAQYEVYEDSFRPPDEQWSQPQYTMDPYTFETHGSAKYSYFSTPSDEYRLAVARNSDAFLSSLTNMDSLHDSKMDFLPVQPQEPHRHVLPPPLRYESPLGSPESPESPAANWRWAETVVDVKPPANPPTPPPRGFVKPVKSEIPPLTYAPLVGPGSVSTFGEVAKKHTPLACLFCRGRKVACTPVSRDPDAEDRSCKQCDRRHLDCVFPKESRRGQHKRRRRPAEASPAVE